MGTLENSKDPGSELFALFRQRNLFFFFFLEILTCDPSPYTMDHPSPGNFFIFRFFP